MGETHGTGTRRLRRPGAGAEGRHGGGVIVDLSAQQVAHLGRVGVGDGVHEHGPVLVFEPDGPVRLRQPADDVEPLLGE